IQIGTKLPPGDPLLDDVLEYAFEPARPPANATAAFPGKMLSLIEEDSDEVGSVDQRREMRFDQQSQSFGGTVRPRGNGFCSIKKALDALHADQFKRGLLGRKIVIEACLLDAEDIGNVLGGGSMEPSFSKNTRRGFDDLGGPPSLAGTAPSQG